MKNQKDGKGRVNCIKEDQEFEGQDNEYAFVVNAHLDSGMDFIVDVGGVSCNFLIDSGSICNVIDKSCWEDLKKKHIKSKSQKTTTQIYAYGSTKPLKVAGKFMADVVCQGREVKEAEFIVIDGTGKPLLGRKTAVCLGVLKIGPQTMIAEDVYSLEDDVSFGKRMKVLYRDW